MATLADIQQQLMGNAKSNEETTEAVLLLGETFERFFTYLERSRLDELASRVKLKDAITNLGKIQDKKKDDKE